MNVLTTFRTDESEHLSKFVRSHSDKSVRTVRFYTDMAQESTTACSPNQAKTKDFHVIIVAAGSGNRFGGDIPKQFAKIHGKAVLRHTIEAFMNLPGCLSTHVVINPDDADAYHDAVTGLDLPSFIAGGKERKNSVYNALKQLSHLKNKDIVLIHDGARPNIQSSDISKLLESLKPGYAATLAIPATDTLRRENNGEAQELVDRSHLWQMQTPQAFYYGDILKAHESTNHDTPYTDDTSLAASVGIKTLLVEGRKDNIKITWQDDLEIMEKLMSKSTYETRTGMGFDVHAFENTPSERRLMLCGVEIEHEFALKGHSDADVGLHALTDAILGAISKGDIGDHFPPSDDAFKNMDSSIFLEKAYDMLKEMGGELAHADITLICEAPKIGPHKEKMCERIARILSIEANRINVKATTTEQLGFTGRGEGIAAQAIASIRLPV